MVWVMAGTQGKKDFITPESQVPLAQRILLFLRPQQISGSTLGRGGQGGIDEVATPPTHSRER
jgi:hypothetical protein